MGKNYLFNTFYFSTRRQYKVFSLSKSTLIYVNNSEKPGLSHCLHESNSSKAWAKKVEFSLFIQTDLLYKSR